MAIQNREAFLARLAGRLGRSPRITGVERPEWHVQPQKQVLNQLTQDELVQVLEKQCKVIHTDFRKAECATLSQVLGEVIKAYHGEQLIIPKDERTEQLGLTNYFDELRRSGKQVHEWDASLGKENQVIAEKADIGITYSDMALAESGTVVLLNDLNKSRSISLLPRSYIAIIPKSTIVPRFTQAAESIRKELAEGKDVRSCVSLVTGPSNSADIEMKLIVGVHGPIEATYIIVEDK